MKTFGTSTCFFCFFLPSLRLIRNFKNVLHFHTDKTGLSDSFEHKGPFLDARVCVCVMVSVLQRRAGLCSFCGQPGFDAVPLSYLVPAKVNEVVALLEEIEMRMSAAKDQRKLKDETRHSQQL